MKVVVKLFVELVQKENGEIIGQLKAFWRNNYLVFNLRLTPHCSIS
jgi:hypothetical protein